MTTIYYRIIPYANYVELFKKEAFTDSIEGSTSFYFFSDNKRTRFNQLTDLGLIEDADGKGPKFNGFPEFLDYLIHKYPNVKLDNKPLVCYL